jgi:malate:Na+ symporter
MFVPLAVGTIAAVIAGILVGFLFGHSPANTFFYIIVPILGGGIGEGVLPLSIAYSEILGVAQPDLIAKLIPAALVGNVFAIIFAGLLKRFGEKKPQYSGNGLLVKTGEDKELLAQQGTEKPVDFPLMGAGLLIACSFFIFGGLMSKFVGIPGPIIMILAAAFIKVARLMPAKMEQGSYHMYRFISSSLTYPLLVGLGALYVPWNDLIKAFTPSYIIICFSVVLAMISSGFFIGFLLKMYPVESAIVTSCHSGLGGTGDVAILSASNRMGLMPFAQISTRIGGVGMVILAAFLLKIFH